MKIKRIISAALCIALIGVLQLEVQAKARLIVDETNPYEEPKLIRVSCYTSKEGAITFSGQKVRPGIIAGSKDWLGSIALLYTYEKSEEGQYLPKEFLGYYEVLDTGAGMDTDGDGKGDSIINGQSIDIFQPTSQEADRWVADYGDYLMIYLVDGEG